AASFGFLVFFSSRRRHTSFSRDWSSDVCSSDLCAGGDRASTAGQAADRFHDPRLDGAGGERGCAPHAFAVESGTGAGTGSAAGWRCAVAGQWQLDTGAAPSGGTGLVSPRIGP